MSKRQRPARSRVTTEAVGPTQAWLSTAEQSLTRRSSSKRFWTAKETAERSTQQVTGDGAGADKPSEAKADEHKPPPKKQGKRKHRKATHTVRKEEKERLLKEMSVLRTKMTRMKQRAKTLYDAHEEEMEEKAEVTKALRQGVCQYQERFSEFACVMSEYSRFNMQVGSPLRDEIRLSKDQKSRREVLLSLKAKKLKRAERFMQFRRPLLDPRTEMGEERRYELENGDFCATRFTCTPFENPCSVKQMFNLIVYYLCNIEISISEKIGHITIREDSGADTGVKGVIQNRLVSTTHSDVNMESNIVVFSDYWEREKDEKGNAVGGDRGYGLIAADFVDMDEQHPYRPNERVRRDVSAVMEVRTFQRQRSNGDNGDSGSSPETVVVLTKWVQTQMHYPEFSISADGWSSLHDSMDLWGRTMHHTVMESLQPNPT